MGQNRESHTVDWNGNDITRIWTVKSGTDWAVYDNLLITPGIPASPYDSWIEAFDLPDEKRGPLDTPAGDGVANLLKYALDIDPLASAAAKVPTPRTMELDSYRYAVITAVVRSDDPGFEIASEISSDLKDWEPAVKELDGVDQSDVPPGFERRSWRAEDPIDTGGLFMRLTVKGTESSP